MLFIFCHDLDLGFNHNRVTNTVKVTLAGYKRHLRAGAAPGPLSRKDEDDDDDDEDEDDDHHHRHHCKSN